MEVIEEHCLRHLQSLETLLLGYNRITTLHHKAFIHQVSLRNLELHHNMLVDLVPTTFASVKKSLKRLTVGGEFLNLSLIVTGQNYRNI